MLHYIFLPFALSQASRVVSSFKAYISIPLLTADFTRTAPITEVTCVFRNSKRAITDNCNQDSLKTYQLYISILISNIISDVGTMPVRNNGGSSSNITPA